MNVKAAKQTLFVPASTRETGSEDRRGCPFGQIDVQRQIQTPPGCQGTEPERCCASSLPKTIGTLLNSSSAGSANRPNVAAAENGEDALHAALTGQLM